MVLLMCGESAKFVFLFLHDLFSIFFCEFKSVSHLKDNFFVQETAPAFEMNVRFFFFASSALYGVLVWNSHRYCELI